MEILYLLIPLAMILLVVIAGFFFWSVKSGQMDDLEGPAYRILMDDDTVKPDDKPKTDHSNPDENAESESRR
ncbi:MAG: cbb3-type cytochrome oxidase assembly protein CcoS [Gammaproteobacteria bacterium]|nr:cbb3-type cytochrome oxidase assembly protein CcoS [Gammaproteobacteria bacterium]